MEGVFDLGSKPFPGEDRNPNKWWQGHANKQPLMAYVAPRALAVPILPPPSERMFSESGVIMSQRKNGLESEALGDDNVPEGISGRGRALCLS